MHSNACLYDRSYNITSCPVYSITYVAAYGVWCLHLNFNLNSLYQSDTDSPLTLFNSYLFVQRACIHEITLCYFNNDNIRRAKTDNPFSTVSLSLQQLS